MDDLSEAVARAFVRARRRAEEIAAQTGTMLIDYVDGKVVRVPPPRKVESER